MTDIDFNFGRYGNTYSGGTSTVGSATSEFHAIEFLADSVVTTITDAFGNTWYNGKSFDKGQRLYGRFNTIKLASGSMVAYKAFLF